MNNVLWVEALASLEGDLVAVEAALREGRVDDLPVQEWMPPAVLGALPQHLVLRAVDLLHRQDAAVAELHRLASERRGELSYVAAVDDEVRLPAGPAFLDAAL
ncbi:MAG: hypothetical protein AB7V23_14815 [Candidatus Nanopelagicales bacterium]